MKKYLFYIAFLSVSLTACDSFLDEVPDNRLRLNDLEIISELVTNAYPNGSTVFLEWMTDNVGADPKNMQRRDMTLAYHWQDIEGEGQDTPTGFWSSAYTAIAHANQALEALDALETNDAGRKTAIRAEALACRAYAHFMLVNIFAASYDPAQAAQTPGVVIMEQPETSLLVTYERSSLQQCYDFIEKDLLEALQGVDDNSYQNSGKYHFTRNAILALMSRFYLFKKDYKNCMKYSTELLGTAYNPKYVRDYRTIYTGTNSEVMARKFTNPGLESNLLLLRKEALYGYMAFAGYRLNEEVIRQLVLTEQDARFIVTYNYGGSAAFIPKYERELVRKLSLTSSSGYPYTIEVALRAEEVLFNYLESCWYENDKTTVRKQLNEYIKGIYGNQVTYEILESTYARSYSGVSKDDLMLIILLDEKRREFVEEGLRWFDIRRHHIAVSHTDVNGATDILAADDPRKILQIPQVAVEYGGLQPNARQIEKNPTPILSTRKGWNRLVEHSVQTFKH